MTVRRLSIPRFLRTEETIEVVAEIAPGDDMFHAGLDMYFESSRSALENIELALLAAGKGAPAKVLDFPCGYGRSLRTLTEAYPQAHFTACDLMRDGVDFCAEKFGATPVYSHEEPDQVEIDDRFDLIWSGSFFTHLDARRFLGFLSLFESLLEPGGMLTFTAHSAGHRAWLAQKEMVEGEVAMLRSFEADGYGYFQYPGHNYGDAMASPAWVTKQLERLPSLRLITYSVRGWHTYQDVIACVKETS